MRIAHIFNQSICKNGNNRFRCLRCSLQVILGESLSNQQRESQSCFSVHLSKRDVINCTWTKQVAYLDAFGVQTNFPPADSFIRTSAAIAAIELKESVTFQKVELSIA